MRKLIIFLCFILSTFSLVSCSKKAFFKSDIELEINESSKYSQEEIDDAITCIKDYFKFPSATLTKIQYDEEKSNEIIEEYLKSNDNPLIDANNFIVLFSDFHVDDSGDNDIFESDTTYTDYKWILKRRSKNGNWKVIDLGY